MTFGELKTKALQEYYPGLFYERIVSRTLQDKVRVIIAFLTLIFFLGSLITASFVSAKIAPPMLEFWSLKIYGVFCIFFSLWLISFALQAFHFTYYFRSIPDDASFKRPPMPFELAKIVYRTPSTDLLIGFLKSHEGKRILRRSGITKEELHAFIKSRKTLLSAEKIFIPDTDYVTLGMYATVLYDADTAFGEFLFSHNVQKKDFSAIVEWVVSQEIHTKERRRG